ncbi:MAG TPA: NAD+ synthase [Candidatus Kapabacteria bacterium]|nr:NAD+ synthase [Candidatus Kapabacteria bacterium]
MEAPHLATKSPLLLNGENVAQVLTIFIREELRRTGLTKAVIGLSGGVDSALSTYLAARALGPENVHVLLMPYRSSTPESISDAEAAVTDLGISSETFGITPMAEAFFEETESSPSYEAERSRRGQASSTMLGGGSPAMDKTRRGNVMARLRMIALYDRSQAMGGLVIGTSNKTESLLGYTTIFGDNASAINPLGDLYKTQVWQLAKFMGVSESIVSKPPTADLWPGQTDEAELGVTYREVDELLYYMVDERESDEELVRRGYEMEHIRNIREKIRRAQYKRRPPIIAKISSRTINADFRYARDWGT